MNSAMKNGLVAAIIVLLISTFTGYFVYYKASQGLKEEIQGYLLNLSKLASGFTDGDKQALIRNPSQKGSSLYEELRAPYFKILQSTSSVAFIYFMIEKNDKIYFILDSQLFKPGEKDETSGVMEEYGDRSTTLAIAFKEKESTVEEEPYTDSYGTFLSGYSPVYDSNKNFVGMIGVDIRVNTYIEHQSKIKNAFLIGLLIAFISSIFVGIAAWFIGDTASRYNAMSTVSKKAKK